MMEELVTDQEDHSVHRLAKNRFVVLIAGTILVSLLLVLISLALYASSGAAQLDLSRPDYSSIRAQANTEEETVKAFPSTGSIDKESLDDFEKLYDQAAKEVTTDSTFNEDTLSDKSLSITSTDMPQ